MKVSDLIKSNNLCNSLFDREITSVYICDKLSVALNKLKEGDIFVTLQANINAVAVAVNNKASCIAVCEGIKIPEDAKTAAEENKISLISVNESSYEFIIKYFI